MKISTTATHSIRRKMFEVTRSIYFWPFCFNCGNMSFGICGRILTRSFFKKRYAQTYIHHTNMHTKYIWYSHASMDMYITYIYIYVHILYIYKYIYVHIFIHECIRRRDVCQLEIDHSKLERTYTLFDLICVGIGKMSCI
jgi:hypothetical protein